MSSLRNSRNSAITTTPVTATTTNNNAKAIASPYITADYYSFDALDTPIRLLGQAFESGQGLQKTYRAVVRGWPADEGLIDHPLKRMPDDMRTERLEVQPAQSRFATLRRFELPLPHSQAHQGFASTRCAEVALQPLTGRRHQLRRHMKHIAHPILGDATHGKGPLNRAVADLIGHQRLWLHAHTLTLPHPVSAEMLLLASPLPTEWSLWDTFA